MQIQLNGGLFQLPCPSTVRELLEQLKMDFSKVAVEVNLKVIPIKDQEKIALNEGDIVEIVTLVGGG